MKIKTFPITVHDTWLDRVGEAVKATKMESKHDYIVQAVEEKMARDLEKSEK